MVRRGAGVVGGRSRLEVSAGQHWSNSKTRARWNCAADWREEMQAMDDRMRKKMAVSVGLLEVGLYGGGGRGRVLASKSTSRWRR